MRVFLLAFLSISFGNTAFCQNHIEVNYYQITDGYVVYADNNEPAPVS